MPSIYDKIAESFISSDEEVKELFAPSRPQPTDMPFTEFFKKKKKREELPPLPELLEQRAPIEPPPPPPPPPPVAFQPSKEPSIQDILARRGKLGPSVAAVSGPPWLQESEAKAKAKQAGESHYWSEADRAWKLVERPAEVLLSRMPFSRELESLGEVSPFKEIRAVMTSPEAEQVKEILGLVGLVGSLAITGFMGVQAIAGATAWRRLPEYKEIVRFAKEAGIPRSSKVFKDAETAFKTAVNLHRSGRTEAANEIMSRYHASYARAMANRVTASPTGSQAAKDEAVRAIMAWKPQLPSFTPGGTAVPGQTRPLAEVMAAQRAELVPKPPITPPAVTPGVIIPDITRKGIPIGAGLDQTMARQLANGTFQVTPSYNLVNKGFERKIFKTQQEAKAYINELQQAVAIPKAEVTPAPGVTGAIPVAPPLIKPPAPPLPPVKPPTEPPVPQGRILGDLQDTDELVNVMTQPDAYRKIANLPGVRQVMSYLNPSGVAKTTSEKAVVARAALREEGVNKVIGGFSNLEAIGSRNKVWGPLDDAQRLTQGKLAGKSLDEVLTYRAKYANDMTPQQAEWARIYHELEAAKLDLLERNGIRINQLSFEEGGEYVGRRVVGRIDPQTGELAESAFIGAPGPGRPGARLAAEKARYFKDINEALEQGFRYLPPDEALYLNMKGAYNRIADKQVTDWVLDRVAYRTTGAPQALIDAASSAKTKLNQSQAMLAALNRALRGERGVPEQIVSSIAIEYPTEAKTLKTLIENIRLGKPTGDAVKLFESKARQLIDSNKVKYWQATNARARAREAALQTHLGEARVSAPAFAGKILTGTEARQTAETLNRAFTSTYGDIDKIIGAVNKVNAIGRYFLLAGDASPLMIQLIAFPFRFPTVFARSVVGFTKALFSPESQASYLARNNDIIQKSRNLILSKGGQTEFTEAFRSGGIMQSKLAKYPKAVLEPFQRGFEGALDTAGIELRKAFDYMATTPERTAAIEQFINEIRGVTSSARLGVTPGVRAAETVALLAPRYMRATLALVSDVARGGIRGDQARKAMIALAGGTAALAIGITLAKGEGWEGVKNHLDITKSTQFLTWDIAGQNVGPGSKFRSFLVLLGKMIDEPTRMVDHASRFMKSNSSIAVSTGIDILTGRDYIGEPTRPGKGVSVGEGMLALTKRVIADNFVPIWFQSAVLEGGDIVQRLVRGGIEFLGGRAYPASAGAIYAQKWREDFKAYNAIPTDPIEVKAKKIQSRSQYRKTHPDIEAKLFIAGQVNTVSSVRAIYVVLQLIQENDIDPSTIRGIIANREEKAKREELGVRDTTITDTDRLVSLIDRNYVSPQGKTQQPSQPVTPSKSTKWDEVRPFLNTAMLRGLDRLWYQGGELAPYEEVQLKEVFKKSPFGEKDFDTWVRQTLRQVYESSF